MGIVDGDGVKMARQSEARCSIRLMRQSIFNGGPRKGVLSYVTRVYDLEATRDPSWELGLWVEYRDTLDTDVSISPQSQSTASRGFVSRLKHL